MEDETDDKPYIILRPGDDGNKDPGQGSKEIISSEPLSALFLECPDLLYTITAHHAGYGTVAGKSFYEETVPDDGDATEPKKEEVRFLPSERECKADIVVEIEDGVNQDNQHSLDSPLEIEIESMREVQAENNEKSKKKNKMGRLRSFVARAARCFCMPYRRLSRGWRERKQGEEYH